MLLVLQLAVLLVLQLAVLLVLQLALLLELQLAVQLVLQLAVLLVLQLAVLLVLQLAVLLVFQLAVFVTEFWRDNDSKYNIKKILSKLNYYYCYYFKLNMLIEKENVTNNCILFMPGPHYPNSRVSSRLCLSIGINGH